jgi:hypothetical protein
MLIHKGLEVECDKLKDEIESSRMCLNDIQELDDIWVIQLPQQTNFTNDIAGDSSFGSGIGKGNALNGDYLFCPRLNAPVDNAVCTLSNQVRPVY